ARLRGAGGAGGAGPGGGSRPLRRPPGRTRGLRELPRPLPALPGQLRAGVVSEGPFSRRALVWLISISVASFATWLVVGLIAPEPADAESAGAQADPR